MTTLSPDSVLTAVISLSLSWLLFPLENPENYLNYPESRGGFLTKGEPSLSGQSGKGKENLLF